MRTRGVCLLLPLMLLLAAIPVLADDVSGSDRLLCAAVHATLCSVDGECLLGPPWNWDIPRFIEIDLKKKTLSTTEASGQHRSTPIKNLQREDGKIFLQGVEGGRAFSFVITEETGLVTVALVRDGAAVGVFGECTPDD